MAKTVYVVDDDLEFCTLIANILQEDGYEAKALLSGEEALAAYRQMAPDLMLLDIAMPGLNGFEVAAAIRDAEQNTDRRTLIVIMTAHSRSYSVSLNFHTGIQSYLLKPITAPEVLTQVHQLLPKE